MTILQGRRLVLCRNAEKRAQTGPVEERSSQLWQAWGTHGAARQEIEPARSAALTINKHIVGDLVVSG